MTSNAYICEKLEPCDVVERLGRFDGIALSLVCILIKQRCVQCGKYPLKTPGNGIFQTLNFKMSLDASALKNLCFWCEFQSWLLFVIRLLLKNVLTALLLTQKKLAGIMYQLLWCQKSDRNNVFFCNDILNSY